MGGHGAWMAAVQGASRALGVASVSGWTKKETYGDSNFLFDQSVNDVSASFVEPALEGVLRAAISENDVEAHLPLLRNVPSLARTGDADNTVHSFCNAAGTRTLVGPLPLLTRPAFESLVRKVKHFVFGRTDDFLKGLFGTDAGGTASLGRSMEEEFRENAGGAFFEE